VCMRVCAADDLVRGQGTVLYCFALTAASEHPAALGGDVVEAAARALTLTTRVRVCMLHQLHQVTRRVRVSRDKVGTWAGEEAGLGLEA
jgi:hypothetical protein